MSKVSTEKYKGVRDFYPEDMRIQNYIFDTWKKVARSFGYEEYNASILEFSELYKSKGNEEIVRDQTYTFTDRGGREVTLRPEMTPSVARMVAAKRRELSFPLRWFSIPNMFRYERPQKGRLREFWQLNADIFGSDSIEADAEIITLAYSVMKEFGAKDEDFEIRISDRKIQDEKYKELGLDNDKRRELTKLLDKKAKMDGGSFEEEFEKLTGKSEIKFEPNEDVKDVLSRLEKRGIKNAKFDESIARGFEYYNGIVFEVFDTSPDNKRSVAGGGRYDGLADIFGEEGITSLGFAMGDVTMKEFLILRNLIPEYISSADLYVCKLDPKFMPEANALANELRANDVNVALDLTDKKVGDQIKIADKKKIPYVICVGEEEVASRKYKLKNLESGDEIELSAEEIPDKIK